MIDNRNCCDHGDNINNREVSIDYPCEWLYKVIGSDKESVYTSQNGFREKTENYFARVKSSAPFVRG